MPSAEVLMLVAPLLLASLAALAPSPATPDPTVGFAQSLEGRHARLVPDLALASDYRLSETPPLRITDDLRLGLADAPRPLDTGGAVSAQTRQLLALLLGLVVGFGTGHLVARDRDGFVLFLVVDVVLVTAMVVLGAVVRAGVFWALGGVGLLVSHVIQALDAYAESGGARIVERTRERAVLVSSAALPREPPTLTTRLFALTF